MHGYNSKSRHQNRSQKVRRENLQQQPLGEPNTNAWTAAETKDNEDEGKESDDIEQLLSPGPKSSDSDSDRSTEKEATNKSKEIHTRDHKKREQEKKKQKEAAKKKK
jgi:hypothetical protein